MKCQNCGTELDENTKFCNECGTAVVKQQDGMVTEYARMKNAYEVIKKIEDFIARKDSIKARGEELIQKRKNIINEWIGVQYAVFFGFVGLAFVFANTIDEFDGNIVGGGILSFILFLIVNKIIKICTMEGRLQRADEFYNSNAEPLKLEEEQTIAEFDAFIESKEHMDAVDYIPEDYRYPEAVEFFMRMFDTKRADSLKESINLFEEHLHRQYMEEMQQNQLELQNQQLQETRQMRSEMQNQSEYMEQISKNTKSAARSAKANAFISAAYGHSNSKKLDKLNKKF